MKINVNRDQDFVPVILTLTLETQAELDAIGTLFNHTAVVDALNKCAGMTRGPHSIWSQLRDLLADQGAQVHLGIFDMTKIFRGTHCGF